MLHQTRMQSPDWHTGLGSHFLDAIAPTLGKEQGVLTASQLTAEKIG